MAKTDTPAGDPFGVNPTPPMLAQETTAREPEPEPSAPRFFDFDLALGGNTHHTVRKIGLTYPEIGILALIHGNDAIGPRTPTDPADIAQMDRDNPGRATETFPAFRDRMVVAYGRARVAEAFSLMQGGMPAPAVQNPDMPAALPGAGFVGA